MYFNWWDFVGRKTLWSPLLFIDILLISFGNLKLLLNKKFPFIQHLSKYVWNPNTICKSFSNLCCCYDAHGSGNIFFLHQHHGTRVVNRFFLKIRIHYRRGLWFCIYGVSTTSIYWFWCSLLILNSYLSLFLILAMV